MAVKVKALKEWLATLDNESEIAVETTPGEDRDGKLAVDQGILVVSESAGDDDCSRLEIGTAEIHDELD